MTFSLEHLELNDLRHPFISFVSHPAENKNQKVTPLHFMGANGFPVAVYASFLDRFSNEYLVSASDCRGAFEQTNTPPRLFELNDFANDLISVIEAKHSQPVIGMGHSFGAHVSLVAAIKRPDLFERLVLIEPASLPNPWIDLFYRKLPKPIVHRIMPFIKKTQQRQRIWQDPDEFIQRYQSHKTFKHFTNEAMQAYAKHGLKQRQDGQYELVFDPDWEGHIFRKIAFIWNNLKKSQTPCLFIRAEKSNLYSHDMFSTQNKNLGAHFTGIEIPGTHHLMPFESPLECEDAISSWLEHQT